MQLLSEHNSLNKSTDNKQTFILVKKVVESNNNKKNISNSPYNKILDHWHLTCKN